MSRIPSVLGVILLLTTAARGQEPQVEIPPVVRTPYTVGGIVEARPAHVWFDAAAALRKLQAVPGDAREQRAVQLNSRVQFDAAYRRGWFTAHTRTVVETAYASARWTGDATAYEAYLSLNPAPWLTVDAGKKTLKWGKGYLWTPAAFLDRVKSPEDPALALEGFTVVSADYIRTFGGPLQVLSLTPVLVPVFGDLNRSFGERGHFNLAGKLYLLLYDTDVDVMFLTGGSRPSGLGFDFSRNLQSNLEIHGEWTRAARAVTPVVSRNGTWVPAGSAATSFVLGLRYLTSANTTFIADYFRNGSGYTTAEMETYFALIERGYDALLGSGDDRLLALARRASEAGYGRMNPMRNYVYGRFAQPDVAGVLYLTLGAGAIVNVDDGSYALLPEVQYKPTENLELRWRATIQSGRPHTEFGEKPADARLELRLRYYF
jgi:hypothetical protein